MAPDQQNTGSFLADVQASCLPELVWTYESTSAAFTKSVLVYRAFRAWNHANKHGFKLRYLRYHGERLTKREVESFNLWIQSGAAMSASIMAHYEATRLFEKIRAGA